MMFAIHSFIGLFSKGCHMGMRMMFAIHSLIGLFSKGCHMGMRRICSRGAAGPVEGSGTAKPGPEGSLDSCLA